MRIIFSPREQHIHIHAKYENMGDRAGGIRGIPNNRDSDYTAEIPKLAVDNFCSSMPP